jgi:hypothetical protein
VEASRQQAERRTAAGGQHEEAGDAARVGGEHVTDDRNERAVRGDRVHAGDQPEIVAAVAGDERGATPR